MRKLAALGALALALVACDASNPVAPVDDGDRAGGAGPQSPGGLTITLKFEDPNGIVAELLQLPTGANPFELTATVADSSGQPPGPSFPPNIGLSTDLGEFVDPDNETKRLPAITAALDRATGVAKARFVPGTEEGTATILAQYLDIIGQKSIEVFVPEPLTASFEAQTQPDGLQVIFTDTSTGGPDRWTWDFGDDSCPGDPPNPECSEQNPVHTYDVAGEFVVQLTAGRSVDGASSTRTQFVSVGAELELVADFTFEASATSLQVIFTDTSQGNPTGWSWDFGDGSCEGETPSPECSQQNPIHEYKEAADYAVTLTATAPGGLQSSKSKFVKVGSELPPLAAAFRFDVAENSLIVQFIDESTGEPVRWQWDFDDEFCEGAGQGAGCSASSEQNPVHEYVRSGSYVVRLTVFDQANNEDLTSDVVRVDSGEVRPVAGFTFDILGGGLTVKFTDTSTNEPTAWTWDFGDGSCPAANECDVQNPSHQYAQAGNYQVTLTAANGAGEDSTTQTVNLDVLEADFSFAQVGCSGVFTDESSGGVTGYEWDFGDPDCTPAGCNESTAQNPTHDYSLPDGSGCDFGDYDVTLRVTDGAGGSSTRTRTITIAPF